MLHISLHLIVPVLVALALYRPVWKQTAVVLLATMLVDLDHLFATPIYDPARCSIGFHPLHTPTAIAAYSAILLLPLVIERRLQPSDWNPTLRLVHLAGLGLVVHMILDWIDCLA